MRFRVVAEIGTNFPPADPLLAVRAAKEAGADVVKLQLFKAERLYALERFRQRLRPFQFPLHRLEEARAIAGTLWASVFDLATLEEASPHLDGIKIASGDLMYRPLVEAARAEAIRREIPLILSDGAADEEEVRTALRWARDAQVILLHCVSAYPASWQDYRLRVLERYRSWGLEVGLSDHTTSLRAGLIALALGATVLERHFHPGVPIEPEPPDAGPWAFRPARFRRYVEALRAADAALGDGAKWIAEAERSERLFARRGSDGLRPREGAR